MTPSLPAAQPATFRWEGRTVRPLGKENDKAFALINALDAKQRSQAILNYRVADLVLGPGQDGKTIQPEGIRVSALDRRAANDAAGTSSANGPGSWPTRFAAPRMAELKSHLNDTYFAWSGPTTNGSVDLFPDAGPDARDRVRAAEAASITSTRSIATRPTIMERRLRSGRIATIVLAAAMIVLAATDLSAHRRDELLQAARIAIAEDSVAIELSVTPGIAVADHVIEELDRDRDGILSGEEKRVYIDALLTEITLHIDGEPLSLKATATFPALEELRAGDRSIEVRSIASFPRMPTGPHRISFSNGHRRDISAYLANALKPEGDRIAVTAQSRDPDQRMLTIDYSIGDERLATLPVWLFGAGAIAWLSARRRLMRSGLSQFG